MNLFESLASLKDAQFKVEQVAMGCSIEVSGSIKVSVGMIEAEFEYFARTYGVKYIPNAICIDDWEIQDVRVTIAGMKIDDFNKFRNGFIDHGMESLSKSLDFYNRKDLIIESFKTNTHLKKIYGEDIILWDNISNEEKTNMYKLLQNNGVVLDTWIINQYELREDGL